MLKYQLFINIYIIVKKMVYFILSVIKCSTFLFVSNKQTNKTSELHVNAIAFICWSKTVVNWTNWEWKCTSSFRIQNKNLQNKHHHQQTTTNNKSIFTSKLCDIHTNNHFLLFPLFCFLSMRQITSEKRVEFIFFKFNLFLTCKSIHTSKGLEQNKNKNPQTHFKRESNEIMIDGINTMHTNTYTLILITDSK